MRNIVGYEKEKAEIAKIRELLRNVKTYKELGVRIPRGLLLVGEPGVGKTVLARSIAGQGIKLVELHAANCCDEDAAFFVESCFEEAKKKAPAVLLLDEIDKLAGTSRSFFMEDNDKIRKILLRELDALTDNDGILVVATCNDEDCMGSALTRPGRFDRRIRISLPDENTRLRILRSYFRRVRMPKNVDLGEIAGTTKGYSGAMLECLVNEAAIEALSEKRDSITGDDVRKVINRMEFGANESLPYDDKETLHRVAVHETGHTVAAMLLCPESLYGATILPQGDTGGHIRFVSGEEKVLSISEAENELAVLLAGHVAERLMLGEYGLGSSSDIQEASRKLQYLITCEAAYGYVHTLGGMKGPFSDSASESVKCRIAETFEREMNRIDAKTEKLLTENRELFDSVCAALETGQTLDRDELNALRGEAGSIAA